MENMIVYIKPELLIVSVLLYGLGVILKKSKLKDNYIPLILGCIGIVVGIVYCGVVEGWSIGGVVTGAVQGLLVAGSSTHIHQVIKQLLKLHKVDEEVITWVDDVVGELDD